MKYLQPILIIVLSVLLGLYVISANSAVGSGFVPTSIPRPSIYITRMDHYRTLEDEYVWVLEYTIDGVFQSPAFTGREAMAEFLEYLGTIGSVYQRKEVLHGGENGK